jgi:predicted transcriptional regulator
MGIIISQYNSQVKRVLNYLRKQTEAVNRTNISEECEIHRHNVSRILSLLVVLNIILEVRVSGRNGIKLYKYNEDFENIISNRIIREKNWDSNARKFS